MDLSWDKRVLPSSTSEEFSIPTFLYGTAWKEKETANLVYEALCAGFKGVDTASQHELYREDLVGDGVRRAISEGKVNREDIYLTCDGKIQTKYTPAGGRNSTAVPYSPAAPLEDQIHAAINSSLKIFTFSPEEEPYLDSLVLLAPLPTIEQTLAAWKVFEQYVPHKIRHLGISNCFLSTLKKLLDNVQVKPVFVQNRFYHTNGFDGQLRKFCRENSIIYQAFWIVTANPRLMWSAAVGLVYNQFGLTPQAALYCLVLALGGTVLLNGTTQRKHMVGDLEALKTMDMFARANPDGWEHLVNRFKVEIGELE